MALRPFVRPRALRRGDRVALVALASPSRPEDVAAGADHLRDLGFDPIVVAGPPVDPLVPYLAGAADARARLLRACLVDPGIAAVIATRGGYGSAQMLPHLDLAEIRAAGKLLIGYSDLTAVLDTCVGHAGLVTIHGPMVEGRLARGPVAYDRDAFLRLVCEPVAFGKVPAPGATVLRPGSARGVLRGGTLTQVAALLGTPWAFVAGEDTLLFLDEVNERPYRLDRLLWQLVHAGVLSHVRGIVLNELPGCDEPGATVTAHQAIRHALTSFEGPVVAGVASGHTAGAMLSLPLGVQAAVSAGPDVTFTIEAPAVA